MTTEEHPPPTEAHPWDHPLALVKPRLRGWLHAGASPLVLAAGVLLVVVAPTPAVRWSAAVYTLAAVILFVASALYNIGTWGPRGHAVLRRLDHGSIFLVIAGTYTPVAVLALHGWHQEWVLVGAWIGAGIGIAIRVVWIYAPRALSTGLYLALGWAVVPVVGELFTVSAAAGALIVAGGALYTVGGVVYGTRWPDPSPAWFGFHEVFHALTLGAWACQYLAILLLVHQA